MRIKPHHINTCHGDAINSNIIFFMKYYCHELHVYTVYTIATLHCMYILESIDADLQLGALFFSVGLCLADILPV